MVDTYNFNVADCDNDELVSRLVIEFKESAGTDAYMKLRNELMRRLSRANASAEIDELRRLWIENEGDIIELKSMLTRYFKLGWLDRLFIRWGDRRLWRDK